MIMGDKDQIGLFQIIDAAGGKRVAADPRIDENDFPCC